MKDIKERINSFFKKEEENLSKLFDQLTLFIYGKGNKDLYYLAKILDHDSLMRLIYFYNGDTIKLPTKKELNKFYLTSVCYFLKEERHWDWSHIKDYLKISHNDEYFSPISIGKKINEIKESLNTDILCLLQKVKSDDIDSVLKGTIAWKE